MHELIWFHVVLEQGVEHPQDQYIIELVGWVTPFPTTMVVFASPFPTPILHEVVSAAEKTIVPLLLVTCGYTQYELNYVHPALLGKIVTC